MNNLIIALGLAILLLGLVAGYAIQGMDSEPKPVMQDAPEPASPKPAPPKPAPPPAPKPKRIIHTGRVNQAKNLAQAKAIKSEEVASRKERELGIDKSPEMQKKRKELIQSLLDLGVFEKIEFPGGTIPRVTVGTAWYALKFDDKKAYVDLIYATYFNDKYGSVRLFEPYNGKEIGGFSYHGGLKLK